jgi:hypothetical protein
VSRVLSRTVLVAVLLMAGLWPFAHHVLVERWEANPWKFAGWAMYTEPVPPVLVALFEPRDGGFVYLQELSLAPVVLAELDRFKARRRELGRLVSPDDLARVALGARQDLFSVSVLVQRFRLDPKTAMITTTRQRYDYLRSSDGGVVSIGSAAL